MEILMRCEDMTIVLRGLLVGMEANAMINTLWSLTEEERWRGLVADSAWAGER
jgi:hypothetical protein